MFLLKKSISAFLLPIPIGFFLLFLALIFLLFNSYKKAKIFLLLSVVWFVLISNQSFSNTLLYSLENTHDSLLKTPKVKYIVVLGSGHKSDENLTLSSQLKSTAINRLVEGLIHYNNLEGVKIIFSGHKGFDKRTHAFMQEKLSLNLKVKKEDIIKLDTPKDTYEEAIETKKIVKNEAFILVTSAFHMKRSMLLFKKQGLNPIAAPTQNLSFENKNYYSYFSAKNIRKVEIAFHEYLGLIWAYIKGYI